MKKFWMVKNGQIGTAHHNREGVVVDFRPVEKPPKLVEFSSGVHIVLDPPKGVEAQQLCLPATLESRQVLEETVSTCRFHETWNASFEGVMFSKNRENVERKHTREAEEEHAAIRAQYETELRERIRGQNFIAYTIIYMSPEQFLLLSNPSSREWGRLGSDGWRTTLTSLTTRVKTRLEMQIVPADFNVTMARLWQDQKWEEAMRQGLLTLKEKEKARRKAEFLGASSHDPLK